MRIASPTGSGKNHVVQRFMAGLLNEGISRRPRADGGVTQTFSGIPSRSWIVLVIPEKANRNANAKAIKGMLGDPDLAYRVVRLESNVDLLSSYVSSYGPVNPFAQLGDRDLDQAWENAVRALREYRESSGVSNAGLREFMGQALEDGERRLRRAVRRCRVGIDRLGLRDVVARVWPAARILTAGAGVLILTPQKLLNVVDTVLGPRSLDLTSPGFAERAIYVCDEGDRQKREWLDALISSHMRYDAFEVMSDLYDQFVVEASPIRGVVTGDQGAWVRILNSKKVAGGSTVWTDVASRARMAMSGIVIRRPGSYRVDRLRKPFVRVHLVEPSIPGLFAATPIGRASLGSEHPEDIDVSLPVALVCEYARSGQTVHVVTDGSYVDAIPKYAHDGITPGQLSEHGRLCARAAKRRGSAPRELCGISQQDVADEADVRVLTVKCWERLDGPEPPEDVWPMASRRARGPRRGRGRAVRHLRRLVWRRRGT